MLFIHDYVTGRYNDVIIIIVICISSSSSSYSTIISKSAVKVGVCPLFRRSAIPRLDVGLGPGPGWDRFIRLVFCTVKVKVG